MGLLGLLGINPSDYAGKSEAFVNDITDMIQKRQGITAARIEEATKYPARILDNLTKAAAARARGKEGDEEKAAKYEADAKRMRDWLEFLTEPGRLVEVVAPGVVEKSSVVEELERSRKQWLEVIPVTITSTGNTGGIIGWKKDAAKNIIKWTPDQIRIYDDAKMAAATEKKEDIERRKPIQKAQAETAVLDGKSIDIQLAIAAREKENQRKATGGAPDPTLGDQVGTGVKGIVGGLAEWSGMGSANGSGVGLIGNTVGKITGFLADSFNSASAGTKGIIGAAAGLFIVPTVLSSLASMVPFIGGWFKNPILGGALSIGGLILGLFGGYKLIKSYFAGTPDPESMLTFELLNGQDGAAIKTGANLPTETKAFDPAAAKIAALIPDEISERDARSLGIDAVRTGALNIAGQSAAGNLHLAPALVSLGVSQGNGQFLHDVADRPILVETLTQSASLDPAQAPSRVRRVYTSVRDRLSELGDSVRNSMEPELDYQPNLA